MRVSLSLVAVVFGFGVFSPTLVAEPPTKGELKTATENLKKIGISFHAYGDTHNDKWADDITDKDGRVLLSWRVAILPYLDEEKLYKQFKLDEPWDSENNKKLIAKMPKVYAPVAGKRNPVKPSTNGSLAKAQFGTKRERGIPFRRFQTEPRTPHLL